jgi:RNA polymerase sigma factor (sigma-70 family)
VNGSVESHALRNSEQVARRRDARRSEARLIRACQHGDSAAIDELIRRHWLGAYRVAFAICHDEAVAEEVAQDALVVSIRTIGRFDRRRRFGAWLHRIAANRSIDAVRKRQRREELERRLKDEPGTCPEPALPPELLASHRLRKGAATAHARGRYLPRRPDDREEAPDGSLRGSVKPGGPGPRAPRSGARRRCSSAVPRNRPHGVPESMYGSVIPLPSEAAPRIEQMFVATAEADVGAEPRPSGRDGSGPDGAPAGRRPLGVIEREIADLAAQINAATCRWLQLVAEFAGRDGHERHGFVSCASWLAWRCSLTPRAAREQVRVALCLEELPRIRAAFAAGRLSYSQVRALTRVAEPAIEEELLELAQEATAAQLERLLRSYRRAVSEEEEEAARERRYLSTRWEDDGTLAIRGSLPAEEGALLLKALELGREALQKERMEAGGDAEPPSHADALLAAVETVIAEGLSEAGGGDRHQVVVHVDADLLAGEQAEGAAQLDGGSALSPESARRLACDASIVTLVEKAGEPLSVGRKTRSVPPSLARALRSRDGGCRFPGCGRTRFVDAHHVRHWAHGGATSLENLVQLCRHHHRLVHEGGFSVEAAGGGFVFRRPDGGIIEAAPRLPGLGAGPTLGLRRRNGRTRPVPSDRAPAPSSGERMDLDHAVYVVAALAERRSAAQPALSAAAPDL